MALPSNLKHMNLFADGVSLVGEIDEVSLPKLTRKTEDYLGGGMVAPVQIDLHQEKLEMEITCAGYLRDAITQYGLAKADGGMWRFAGAYQRDDTGDVMAVEIIARGRFSELDRGKAKVGSKSETKMKAALTYYKESIDGVDQIEIDAINFVFVIRGVDMLAKHRKAIGLL